MSEFIPLLATKLYRPLPRPNVVRRARLIERLDAGLHRKLTLVAAPAGFGKTTLLSEWLARCGRPVAWLSLDERDNDPTRFLTYLVAALQTLAPHMGTGVVAVLQSPQPPRDPLGREAMLTALLNEITTLPEPCVIVLDDYHVVDAGGGVRVQGTPAFWDGTGAVDQALTFLVEHLPSQMHLVIATREDPPLPLARLRARGQLTEVRAADLRFTPAEAADFLNGVMGLNLSAHDIATLEARTEGWIAGLQLAALSLQGHQDIPAFIRAFTGDHRYIVDYLVEEVLQRQPEEIRRFLLQTAILDRLHGPLCDAVTGQEGGSARLEALHRSNFFVVPLDDKRHWYRYHHLFAEVLAAHLRAEQPEQLSTLHRRASAWYEQHEMAADAIRHALAAQDFAHAADLVELAWPAIGQSRQDATLLGWLKALPDALLHGRPVLSVAYAHVLLANGTFEGVEDYLLSAERWLETTDKRARPRSEGSRPTTAPKGGYPLGAVGVDEAAFRRLPGMIAIARAGLALARGDVAGAVSYAQRALDLAPGDDHQTRGGAVGFLGLAAWTSGDLELAHRTYTEGIASLQKAGNLADAINGAITLATIRMAQGRLRQAMQTYERGLQLATAQHPEGPHPVVRGAADMHVGMSELYRERNDLHAATQHLLISQELGEHTGFPQNRYRWRIAMARLREAQGDLEGALTLLDEAERLYMSDFSPTVRPITALKTRVWVAQGRLGEALDWAQEQGLSAHDDLSYLREFEHIMLARVLLAQYQREHIDHALHEAIGLLARLLEAAEAGRRSASVLEILVLQALAYHMHGDLPAALLPLSRALTLAEPEGYVRIFVDEGPPMAALLEEAAQHRLAPTYVRQLLSAFPEAQSAEPSVQNNDTPALRSTFKRASTLVEPLSERERDVLRLLRTDLSGPDIARQLMVSLSTIRTHTRNIYDKLGVTNRRAAIHRAEELDLF